VNLRRLVGREIIHRKVNFLLAVATVAIAVGSVLVVNGLLKSHDLATEEMLEEMNAETMRMQTTFAAEAKAYEDGVRKTMKGLGFNIFIFPEGQELSEVYAEGFASETMPEAYVNKLAQSKIVTVNHLLPSLTRKLKWPEKERTVILIGIRGEVPIAHRDPKKPLIDPVPKGKIVLGYELHRSLDLKEGNATLFMGREFIVEKCHGERGTKDDITVWMHLDECQELLGQEDRINAIKALECNCASIDRLGEIRKEIAGILPGTKVIETESKALARAEARNKAKKHAEKTIAAKNLETEILQRDRRKLRKVSKSAYDTLLAITGICAAIWIGFLAFSNARERQTEIGILRAMGVPTGTVLKALLGRAFLIGFAGAGIALAIPFVLGEKFQAGPIPGITMQASGAELFSILLLAPLLTCAASWLPVLQAANQDPANVLRNE